MILSDPSGLIEENTMHYILKLECSEVVQINAIICLFLTVYSQYFSTFFGKGPWLAYNNITYSKIAQKLF